MTFAQPFVKRILGALYTYCNNVYAASMGEDVTVCAAFMGEEVTVYLPCFSKSCKGDFCVSLNYALQSCDTCDSKLPEDKQPLMMAAKLIVEVESTPQEKLTREHMAKVINSILHLDQQKFTPALYEFYGDLFKDLNSSFFVVEDKKYFFNACKGCDKGEIEVLPKKSFCQHCKTQVNTESLAKAVESIEKMKAFLAEIPSKKKARDCSLVFQWYLEVQNVIKEF